MDNVKVLETIACELNDILRTVELVEEKFELEIREAKENPRCAAEVFLERADLYVGAWWTVIHTLRRWDNAMGEALR